MKLNFKGSSSVYFMAMFSKVFIVFLSIITSAIINRTLGVELKGEYAYINNLTVIGMIIFSFGIGQTYSMYRRKYGEQCLNYFLLLTYIHGILCFSIFVISYILKFDYYIYMTFLLTSFLVIKNNLLYITAVQDVKKRDFNNIIYKIIYFILILLVYFLNIKSLHIMLIMLAIENIIIIIGCIKTYKFKIRLKEILKKNKLKIREIYRTGIISMLMLLMMSFNYNIDIIILKQLSSSYSVGLYSIAVNLANMLWLIPDAFKDVLFNKTSKNDSINEIVLSTKLNLYLNIIITIGFIILGKQFINFMYGKEFIEAYNSTVILFIGCMVMIIYKLIHPLYIALGKQTLIFNILLASVFINIILNYILIPKFDIIGAAIASVCSYTICGIVFLIIFCKQYNVQISRFFVFNNDEINMFKTLLRRKKEK